MTKKRCGRDQRLVVSLCYVSTSDADKRFSRAVAILVRAGARDNAPSGEGTIIEELERSGQVPGED